MDADQQFPLGPQYCAYLGVPLTMATAIGILQDMSQLTECDPHAAEHVHIPPDTIGQRPSRDATSPTVALSSYLARDGGRMAIYSGREALLGLLRNCDHPIGLGDFAFTPYGEDRHTWSYRVYIGAGALFANFIVMEYHGTRGDGDSTRSDEARGRWARDQLGLTRLAP